MSDGRCLVCLWGSRRQWQADVWGLAVTPLMKSIQWMDKCFLLQCKYLPRLSKSWRTAGKITSSWKRSHQLFVTHSKEQIDENENYNKNNFPHDMYIMSYLNVCVHNHYHNRYQDETNSKHDYHLFISIVFPGYLSCIYDNNYCHLLQGFTVINTCELCQFHRKEAMKNGDCCRGKYYYSWASPSSIFMSAGCWASIFVLIDPSGSSALKAILMVAARFAPSQWETSLQSNAISHWLGANLE